MRSYSAKFYKLFILIFCFFYSHVALAVDLPPCPAKGKTSSVCQGIREYPDGLRYVGSFKDGKLYGKGTLTWTEGTIYSGDFSNDNPNGHGVKVWGNDGRKYVGEFRDGMYEGKGILYDKKGVVIKSGMWSKNNFVK